jgi:nicotinamidase-related amidase
MLARLFRLSNLKPIPLYNLKLSRTIATAMAQQTTTPDEPLRRLDNPALFICDLQERFRPAIYEFSKVISTTQKMLKASEILHMPIFATTQNAQKLGATCPELALDAPDGYKTMLHVDKMLFSMITPEIEAALVTFQAPVHCVIVGIESHICVLQTSLDLLEMGHKVYVLADGVSSCNKEEIPIALNRLKDAGAIVTTSESWMYECVGDAGREEFREITKLVRETKVSTKEALMALSKM